MKAPYRTASINPWRHGAEMNNRVSNFKVAVIVTILVGIGYVLSAEHMHSTKHNRFKQASEREASVDVSFVPMKKN